MKVAIDVSPLNSAHQFRGVGQYTKNLIASLQLIKSESFSVELIEKSTPRDCDIIHYPYFDLFFLTLPLVKPRPTIVTIHDVTPLIYPEHYPKGIRGWLKFQIQKVSLKSVAAVITDSKNSQKDIINYLEFPEERIFVIPPAPAGEFRPIESRLLLHRIKLKYKLPEKFILYVGDVNYNKNIPTLIKACKDLSFPLVICGKQAADIENMDTDMRATKGPRDWIRLLFGKPHPELAHYKYLLKEFRRSKDIIRPGFVPNQDLGAIYNLATVYCQPSFYEGFGLPVLEAMACGVPVVTANVASLPEIAGKAGVLIDPYDINSIAGGIKEAIANRNELIKKGLVQAGRFSWEKTARETFKIYQKIFAECQK